MAEFVDILNHLIKFKENTINFILDKQGNPWFFVRDILKILEYKDIKDVIKNNIKKENKTKIIKINKEYKTIFGSEMHPHTICVNEFGLYDLILKSKMKKAERFRKLVITKILPSIRQFGYYEVGNKEKQELKEFNQKLNDKVKILNKKINTLENNMKKGKYPHKKVVYIVRPKNVEKIFIKIGKASDLAKRMNVINNSLPDHADVLYYVETDDIDILEDEIKKNMIAYLYKKGKEYYKISVPKAKIIFDKCNEYIKNNKYKKNKVKRLASSVNLSKEISEEFIRHGLENELNNQLDEEQDESELEEINEDMKGGYNVEDDNVYLMSESEEDSDEDETIEYLILKYKSLKYKDKYNKLKKIMLNLL